MYKNKKINKLFKKKDNPGLTKLIRNKDSTIQIEAIKALGDLLTSIKQFSITQKIGFNALLLLLGNISDLTVQDSIIDVIIKIKTSNPDNHYVKEMWDMIDHKITGNEIQKVKKDKIIRDSLEEPNCLEEFKNESRKAESFNLLEYCDNSKGTDDIYEMLRKYSASEIEKLCKIFPIENLRLDYPSIQCDFRNSRRFEFITFLAQILIRYKEILQHNPEKLLPKSLPAEKIAEVLMSRLMSFIKLLKDVDIAQNIRIRLYDFALSLIQAWRDNDALTCLIVSKPSPYKDHDFWIFTCYNNIAIATKKPDDIAKAINIAEKIKSGKIIVPEKNKKTVNQVLDNLKSL